MGKEQGSTPQATAALSFPAPALGPQYMSVWVKVMRAENDYLEEVGRAGLSKEGMFSVRCPK